MKDLPDDAQTGDRFVNNVENVKKIEGTRASHKIDRRRTVPVPWTMEEGLIMSCDSHNFDERCEEFFLENEISVPPLGTLTSTNPQIHQTKYFEYILTAQ
jgi:hypothetical protein